MTSESEKLTAQIRALIVQYCYPFSDVSISGDRQAAEAIAALLAPVAPASDREAVCKDCGRTFDQHVNRPTTICRAFTPKPTAQPAEERAVWRDNLQAYQAALRMIREWVEQNCGVGAMPSEEAVLCLNGPEPHHEAEWIIAALDRARAGSEVKS